MYLMSCRVAACKKGGPARSTDGALGVGSLESDSAIDQTVQCGCMDMGVSQCRHGVPALLVRTVPKYVGLVMIVQGFFLYEFYGVKKFGLRPATFRQLYQRASKIVKFRYVPLL